MIQRHGVADDLVEEFLTQFDPCCPTASQLTDRALVPPEPGPAGERRINTGRDLFIFVGQLDMRVEEPLHLVAYSRVRSPRLPPPIGAMPSRRMNPESEESQEPAHWLWVRTASVHTQASNRRERLPKGSPV